MEANQHQNEAQSSTAEKLEHEWIETEPTVQINSKNLLMKKKNYIHITKKGNSSSNTN